MHIRISLLLASFIAACGGDGVAGTTLIGDVQGSGATSPLDGRTVTISGVVSGDFQEKDADDSRNLGGFYITGDPDGDPSTSDGVFVFDGNNPALDVNVGDRVEVTGEVNEYFGETQIVASSVSIAGSGAVSPVSLDLPVSDTVTNEDGGLLPDLERYEGMLVMVADTLTVTNLRHLERFGEASLSAGGRLFQFTNDNAPSTAGYNAHRDANARRTIVLDDGRRDQNPGWLRLLNAGAAPDYSIRLGDTIDGLTGNLRYSRGAGANGEQRWRIVPTGDPVFDDTNPRPGAPSIGGSIRVGAFNILNFFTTIDTGADNCGPEHDDRCRGADSATEFDRQLEKTVTALIMSGADVLGLTELENNASDSLSELVDALNARAGAGSYAWIDTGIIHTDVIKPGIIYRPSTVTPVGDHVLLDRSVDSRFNDNRNRPALAQAFEAVDSGARFSVVVNHLKSKGSSCDADGDPNLGDGQGNCNVARTTAATALAEWVATDPTGSGDSDYLVIGDMNAYAMEDPIKALRNGGLENLLDDKNEPYSFNFDEQSGAYDYAFATSSLATQVSGTIEWHINVDEPPVLDYNLEYGRDAALFDGTSPYRASDHDPVIVGLDLTR